MNVSLRYFAILREKRGLTDETVSTEVRTVGELYDELALKHSLPLHRPHVRAAVNGAFVADDYELREGDHVVFIPPMAGG